MAKHGRENRPVRPRHTPVQTLLGELEKALLNGATIAEAAARLNVSEATLYRWKRQKLSREEPKFSIPSNFSVWMMRSHGWCRRVYKTL